MRFHFFAEGEPKGQPRTRSTRNRKRHYTPPVADKWKSSITAAALQVRPAIGIRGAAEVVLCFVMPRPASLSGRKHGQGRLQCHVKPDADNLAKAVLDELNHHGFFDDDARISRLVIEKWYAAVGEPTGCHITIAPHILTENA